MLDTLLLLPLAILLHLTTPLPSSLNDPSSLIICSVSGQIYTFDAYKGTPRGLFSSGSPLISSSSMDGSLIEQIIPGLDGNIYTLRQDGGGGVSMDVLPVSVQDVTSRPVSTCQNDGECGILMGEKKSRVYALDVWSGKARWMSGKGWDDRKIWTSRGGASRKTVLLQREDYWVRMVDVDTGLEKWNVTVGNFAALDFGSSRDDGETRRARVEGFQQKKVLKELGGTHIAWGATEDNSKKIKDVTTMKQIKFPSVAFGKDGMSVIAVDGTSGVFMWERRVDAVVAAVYGVGRENSWVPLKVIDESDILYDFPHSSRASFSLPGPNAHPLIPYINQEDQMDDLLRIHSHDSALFLTSQPEPTARPFIIPHIPQPLSLPQPSSEPSHIHPQPPPYQKSHGLFLSWRMVFILTFTLSIVAFMARRAYIQQKQLLKKVTTQPKPSAGAETNGSLSPASSPSIPPTIPSNSSPDHSQLATKATATTTATTTINGIPFTHYSRYKSEFTEVSALGKGGFGTVFKCLNTLDGREYAAKKIYLKKENLEKVLREVKILALLDHPNIVRYYTAWLEVGEMGKQGSCWTGSTNCLFDRDDTVGSKESRESHGVSQSANESSNFQRDDDDDWGFHWDRSEGVSVGLKDHEEKSNFSLGINRQIRGAISEGTDDDSSRQSLGFHWQRSESLMTIGCGESQEMDIDSTFHDNTTTQTSPHSPSDSLKSTQENSTAVQSELTENKQHYILYIQMQLCSQKTIADYILDYNSSPKKTNPPSDIPSALKLFSQIARGVKHVHSRKLIHRDLKPSNCFIDDQGVVKIGDFGLSRESATPISNARIPSSTVWDENTGGIGTKSYASPEQIQGTDYDNKTDVYSLGIMLFELCYPMSTLMERGHIITKLRNTLTFPPNWHTQIKPAFPTLHTLLTNMLSPNPRHRPSSLQISHHIDSLLSEYTPHTLDKTLYSNSTTFLLRVEAHDNEGVLRRVLKLIQREHPSVEILQFGLRGVAGKMIIEVALSEMTEGGDGVLETLRGCDEVMLARRVMGLETNGVVNDVDGRG